MRFRALISLHETLFRANFVCKKTFVSLREVFIRVAKATLLPSFLGIKTAPSCRLSRATQMVGVITMKSVSERRPGSQLETS